MQYTLAQHRRQNTRFSTRKPAGARRPLAIAAAAGLAIIGPAAQSLAQPAPEVSQNIALQIDSGRVQIPGQPMGADAALVYQTQVHVPGAPWLRITSMAATLAGDLKAGTGSYLIITSLEDGAHQRLDAQHLEYWNNTSAYFNGDTLNVELYAYPGTGANSLRIDQVTAGDPNQVESICGNVDDRTPFSDPRVAHLRPIGCTAWIAGHGLSANRFFTAGHCISASTSNAVVMFNMPLSTGSGSWRSAPPEYQYPVQQASIQSTGDVGVGNDAATFQVFPNSNTGLVPRHAQREAFPVAISSPSVANPPQIIRITGHGSRDGTVTTPIPQEWNSIGKTHTGNYVQKTGTTLRYSVDTTGGNSGSPIILDSSNLAIGIHTHAGCNSTGGSNQGTAIEMAAFQAFLSSPLGTSIPLSTPPSLGSPFAANNGGAAGGAVYFDVEVGAAPVDIWGLDLNINSGATPGDEYTVDVYLTPNTRVGKESTAAAWTRIARGRGIVNPRDSISRVVLPSPFRLVQGSSQGIAIVLSGANAGQAYTNGNNVYSNAALTIETGAAANVPFDNFPFQERTWNGRLVYDVEATTGQCHETFFTSNNFGSAGGAVYFDVDVFDVPTVRVTEMKINSTAPAGTALTLDIYRRPGTSVGQQTGSGWVQVGTASGTAAGQDVPTTMTLSTPFYLAGNSSQGIALVLNGGAHAYTNGNGFNEVSWNATMRISDGSATNIPFTGTPFLPRVFNGGFCYILGTGPCPSGTDRLLANSPPNPAVDGRNSNTTGQQIADDFTLTTGANISRIKTWAAYTGDGSVPQSQSFTVNIYAHDGGTNGPGTLVYTRNIASVAPVRTGHIANYATTRDLYEFNIPLSVAFQAQANTQYWISILGDTNPNVWAWHFLSSTSGTRRSRPSGTAVWSSFSGSMAWEFCGVASSAPCYANCDNSTVPPILNVDDFTCFINAYAAAQALPVAQQITAYANCDGSTIVPVLNVDDFTCFINEYAAGCP